MSSIFVMPRQQAFDMSGNTIADARLYFFEVGTSIPKNIFADVYLNISLSNPVIADSAGRFPAIYLDNSAYKVVFRSNNDDLIWEVDNYINQPMDVDVLYLTNSIDRVISSAGLENSGDDTLLSQAIFKYANASTYYLELGTADNAYILTKVDVTSENDSYTKPNDYFVGMQAWFIVTDSRKNMGVATVNIDGLGSKTIKRFDGTDLFYGDMYGIMHIIYNGTNFLLQNPNKSNLVRFCANEGQVIDVNGVADLFSYTGTTLSFKVGNNDPYRILTVTNSRGETATIKSISNITLSGNDLFTIYTDLLGNAVAYNAPFTVSKAVPPSPVTNQVLYYTAGVPRAIIFNGTNWVDFNLIPLGDAVVSGGIITSVRTFPYNNPWANLSPFRNYTDSYSLPIGNGIIPFSGIIEVESIAIAGDAGAYITINGKQLKLGGSSTITGHIVFVRSFEVIQGDTYSTSNIAGIQLFRLRNT